MNNSISFDPSDHVGINLTGFYNQKLNDLGFQDYTFTIDKYKNIEEEVLTFIGSIITEFRKTFVVLPHLKPAIPYIVPAIREITGYSPVIVYLKQKPTGEYEPVFTDMEKYKNHCRSYRSIVRQRILDESRKNQ